MSGERPRHIVRSFAAELRQLTAMVAEMGALVETQLGDALTALVGGDTALAARVIAADPRVDALQREIETLAVRVLALRQPLGSDLRMVVAAFKIAGDLERIGDYAANAAKRTRVLASLPAPCPLDDLQRLARMVATSLRGAVEAFVQGDATKANAIWHGDAATDEVYSEVFRKLLERMMEDPRNIPAGTHLMFIAKNLERVGDHATNIAELVYYAVHGEELDTERPKSDTSVFAAGPERGS